MKTSTSRDRSRISEQTNDTELIELVRQGSERAARILVQRYNRQLFRTARGVVRDDAEAEDIVQETYVRAFTNLDKFRGEAAFSTWLTRIALNEALGRLRRQRTIAAMPDPDAHSAADDGRVILFPMASAPASPESELGRRFVRRGIEQAVDDLPAPFRMVFILRDVEGLNTAETSDLLGIREVTVKTRLHRARRMIRRSIERKLAPRFGELFPFDGERCADVAIRVVRALAEAGLLRPGP